MYTFIPSEHPIRAGVGNLRIQSHSRALCRLLLDVCLYSHFLPNLKKNWMPLLFCLPTAEVSGSLEWIHCRMLGVSVACTSGRVTLPCLPALGAAARWRWGASTLRVRPCGPPLCHTTPSTLMCTAVAHQSSNPGSTLLSFRDPMALGTFRVASWVLFIAMPQWRVSTIVTIRAALGSVWPFSPGRVPKQQRNLILILASH